MKLRGLRLRFVCVTMSIVTLMLSILFGMVMGFTKNSLEEQSIQLIRASVLNPVPPGPISNSIPRGGLPCIVLQVDQRGDIHVYNSGGFDLTDKEFLRQLVSETLAAEAECDVLSDYSLRYYKVTTPNGHRIAYADISSEIRTLENLLRTCILIAAGGFALFLLISLLLARWTAAPTEKAWNLQRQFIADASHELKTPLTVITTNAELLQNEELSDSDRDRASAGILTMAKQMRHLVDGLLDLARLDNGSLRNSFDSVDLSHLMRETVIGFEALFYERERILTDEIEDNIHVRGSREHLRQVLDILLDNAQKYSVNRSEVLVTLQSAPHNHCTLCVASIGETISQADLKKIFTRFYRINPSRSRDGSYGLGLSIAQHIVHEHKGKIWAESQDEINRFYVELPTE